MGDSVLTSEVKEVLSRATANGNVVVLPSGQLERGLYAKVNKALANAGGKWKTGVGHVFATDAAPKLAAMLGTGVSVDEKKRDQAFFTPPDLAIRVVALANVQGQVVLEPSAGHGALADVCMTQGAKSVHCVEINAASVAVLRGKGYQVTYDDFLKTEPNRRPSVSSVPLELIEPGVERWLPVVGYEEFYEVSTHGNVRRLKTRKGYKAGTLLTPSKREDGYMNVVLARNGTRESKLAHQIVAEAFIGPCPEGAQLNHKHPDGDRSRNWLSNLEYLTSQQNNADQMRCRPANYAVGLDVPNTKLTPLAVESIKQRLRDGEARDSIARDHDVTTATIWAIDNGRTWINRLPLYSRIILNPPFTKNQDIKHVRHALKWLAPGGILVAIMLNNQTRKGFMELVAEYDPEIDEVERGVFKESGTDVPTIIVKIEL